MRLTDHLSKQKSVILCNCRLHVAVGVIRLVVTGVTLVLSD
jgi:hypothetical protein